MSEPGTKVTLRSGTIQATSQLNRVCGQKVDAAFEKMLDLIAGSPCYKKSVDLFGTGGTEMEHRVLARRKKDFQVGSEDWNDVTFTRHRFRWTKDPQSRPYIEVSQDKAIEELTEIFEELDTKYRSLLGQINRLRKYGRISVLLQVFQMCF